MWGWSEVNFVLLGVDSFFVFCFFELSGLWFE